MTNFLKVVITRLGVDKVKPKGWFKFFLQTSSGDHSETFFHSKLFCGTSPSWLKVIGGAVGLVGVVGWMVGP